MDRWSDHPDSDHPIEWESADGREKAYLTWDGAIGRLVPSWYVNADDLRAYLEDGGTVRTSFAFYRLSAEPTDYSKSKYESATAERAHAVVLEGFADDTIIGPDDMVAFDLVTTDDDGAVILRYDSQGFVDVETSERDHALNGSPADVHGHYGRARVLCHFEYLRREYEPAEDGCDFDNAAECEMDRDDDAPGRDTTGAPAAMADTYVPDPPFTFVAAIRQYGGYVRDTADSPNGFDDDLLPGQRTLLGRLLLAVSAGHSGAAFVADDPILTVIYPPSDSTRDGAVALLHRIVRDTIARPDDFGLTVGQWDETVSRAAECLRNI